LRTACLTGVATTKLSKEVTTPDGNTVALTAGDIDEAVSGLLTNGLAASDVNGETVPAGFSRIDAFRIGVLNALDPFSTSGEPCAPDCAPAMLANEACDLLCNTTRCAFDRGTCLTELEKQCSPGCSGEWLEDGGACRMAAPRSIGWVAACCIGKRPRGIQSQHPTPDNIKGNK
jgi:hypothetical protein